MTDSSLSEEKMQIIKSAVDNFYDTLNSRYRRLAASGLIHLDEMSKEKFVRNGRPVAFVFTYYTTVGSIEDYGLTGIFDDLPPRENGMGPWMAAQGAIRGYLRDCVEEHVPENSDFYWVSEEPDAPYFKLDRVAFSMVQQTATVG